MPPASLLNDPAIRRRLVSHLQEQDPLVRIRHEMGVARCVADVVAVSLREFHIYEIKSDRDGTDRLGDRLHTGRRGRTWTRPGQVKAYSAVADRVTLVVGTVLLEKSLPLIPDWWGVVVALEEPDEVVLVPHREAQPNPAQDWTSLEKVLWRAEAEQLCEKLGCARGVRGGSRVKLRKRLRENKVPLSVLRDHVVASLRARTWSDGR